LCPFLLTTPAPPYLAAQNPYGIRLLNLMALRCNLGKGPGRGPNPVGVECA